MPIRRLCVPAGMGVNTLTPSGKLLKYGRPVVVHKTLEQY